MGARPLVVLYDGHCPFCRRQAKKLLSFARKGAIELRDFQRPGALEAFPQVTYDECMRAMQVVATSGKVYPGFEGVVRILMTRRLFGWVFWLYYVPPLRWIADGVYRWIANNRYRLVKDSSVDDVQEGDACSIHIGQKPHDHSATTNTRGE